MAGQYTTLHSVLTRLLTPQAWKEAHHRHRPTTTASRWDLHPLLVVLLLMTWTTGDSEAERFATARAVYVARHQHSKRPGKTLAGFQKALAKLPLEVLQTLFAAVRTGLRQLVYRYWRTDGFVVMAIDASRLECPRSAELEKRLGKCGKADSAPMLMVAALVLLPAGLLWSWAVGPGASSEHELLRQLLPTLPRRTLLVADAFYQGYDLYRDLLDKKASFLVRLSSKSWLYTEKEQPLERFRDGRVWLWPEEAQNKQLGPLELRLIRVRGKKKRRKGQDVWLLTNVLEKKRLSWRRASELYRWRWQVEGIFRTYKRTLPKLKLWSRTETLVYREAEVALLGLQLLLAQGVSCSRAGGMRVIRMGSARQQLLKIRGEMTTTVGACLGPWQQRWYQQQLAEVHQGGPARKVRRKWPRRKEHKAPKPPKLRVMPEELKARINRQFTRK